MEQCARAAEPRYPTSIRNAPVLTGGLELYYMAFQTLSTERNESGYIPWSSIQAYCLWHDLSIRQTENMHYLLMRLDTTRNEWLDKKGKSDG